MVKAYIYIYFLLFLQAKRVSDRKGISKKRPCLDLGRSTDEPMILAPAKVRTRTSSSSSSSTPKSIDSSKSLSESVKQKEGHKSTQEEKPHLSTNTGLLLILISLAMTVLWGRLSAIVFTSIWLCFLPLSSYAGNPGPQYVTKSPEIESEDHKIKSTSIGRDCLKGSIIG